VNSSEHTTYAPRALQFELRRLGFRFIALADDNFYPVTLTDLRLAEEQDNTARLNELKTMRAERFALMRRLAQLPPDTIFFTQITMEPRKSQNSSMLCRARTLRALL
jgi:hypothetical protein